METQAAQQQTSLQTSEVTLEISLPRAIFDELKSQSSSGRGSIDLGTLIRTRLMLYGSLNSAKPIILSDADRQHLERLVGRNLSTSSEVVALIQRALSCSISGMQIPLSLRLMERLKSRALGMELEKYIILTITRALETEVGLR